METLSIPGVDAPATRVALGTWSMGGWMWGGADEQAARATVARALDLGVTTIDTAPVYGFGLSEEMVGDVVRSRGARDRVVLATKAGLVWDARRDPWKDASPRSVAREVEDSLRRLRTDVIDVYQIHWPDPATPVARTAEAVRALLDRGIIRAAGVCNFSVDQIEAFSAECPITVCQSPYSLFQRGIERDVLPYCRTRSLRLLAYSPLARGLLAGTMRRDAEPGDQARRTPMFHGEEYRRHIDIVERLDDYAHDRFGRRVIHLAVRWILDGAEDSVVLWGARRPEQLDALAGVGGWRLDERSRREIEAIVDGGSVGRQQDA